MFENLFLKNAKSKNFILEYIKAKLSEDTDNAQFLVSAVGIDETLILILSLIEETDVKYGDKLTLSYILNFYTQGLNFSEIAWIKDISEDGIRFNIHSLVKGREFAQLKYINSINRRKLKDKILMIEVLNLVEAVGFDVAREKLGYTELYFKRLCSRLRKIQGRLEGEVLD